MTIVVPRSGSRKTSATTGPAMIRNGTTPPQNDATLVPRLANQCAR